MYSIHNFIQDAFDAFDINDKRDAHWKLALKLSSELGFDTLNIGMKNALTRRPSWFRSSMPPGITAHVSKTYFGFQNPVEQHVFKSFVPLTIRFGEVQKDDHEDPLMYQWDQDFKRFGFDLGHWFAFDTAPDARLAIGFIKHADRAANDDPNAFSKLRALAGVLALKIGNEIPTDGSAFVISKDFTLRPREKQVLTFLAGGYSNDEIAKELDLAEVTVRKHIRNARIRLGGATREQALVIAVQNNLLGRA